MTDDLLVGLPEIRAARQLLSGVTRETPLEPSRPLTALLGGPAWLKCENLQRAGSFKVRGAYVRISGLSAEERSRGVVAASAGNHAQGVALAASLLGADATVFMPVGAPLPKLAATKGYGATVELAGDTVDDALVAAQKFADRTGAILIHPFDHPDVIAGQGTVALEILERCPDVRTIVVSVGGGGLISGIAVAAKALRPDIRIIGVQAEGAAAYPASLLAGRPDAAARMSTIADGIAVGCPGDITFAHVTQAGRRGRDGHRRGHLARAAGAAGAGQAGGRAGRRGRRGGAAGRPVRGRVPGRWRCSPAATSTRCCWCR